MNSYDVRFWSIKTNYGAGKHSGKRPAVSHTVRWKVARREKSQTFKYKSGAENFLFDLRRAVKNEEAFDVETGLPESMTEKPSGVSWLDYSASYVAKRWGKDAPNTRKGVLEALATTVPALVRDLPGKPDRKILYRAVCHYALPPVPEGQTAKTPPPDIAAALRWLEKASLPVSAVMDEDVLTEALKALTLRLDGKPAAANTVARKRSVLYNALKRAAKGKKRLIPKNPMPDVDWEPDKAAEQIDRRSVCNPRQAAELLTAVTYVGSRDPLRGRRLVAMFGCMYYGALRTAEALALREQDCDLPESGWGMLYLAKSSPEVGKRYTGTGNRHDPRHLKHRAANEVRPVPIPPVLVRMLREHISEFGTAPDGRLFRQPGGNVIPSSSYTDVWRQARLLALPPDKADSPLAERPYDLRHAGVSAWLNSGVPPTKVAERAGHSVNVLLRVYAKCMDGDDAIANRRIDRMLGGDEEQDDE
ncbi:tyrosine-type recombinase/integrase [Nocardiopsis sp. CNT-189]|uniref:tyrosine-type recombinase/integrase n=1 Tax=Nocardiopsis oceanisediminis TaxID=2816862 RepID=UPI003B30C5D9